MIRFILLFIVGWSASVWAKNDLYQIDLIILAHETATQWVDNINDQLFYPNTKQAIHLESPSGEDLTPYKLLPAALSGLRSEYWALAHKSPYQILGRYTWLQPSESKEAVVLPNTSKGPWSIHGTIRVRHANLYQLSTNLLFSPYDKKQTKFSMVVSQQLKPNVVYYIDHPQAGLLVKIQRI